MKKYLFFIFIFIILNCSKYSLSYDKKDIFNYASKLTQIKHTEDALKYYKILLNKKNINKKLKAKIYNNMAVIYESKNYNLEAKKYYKKALKLDDNKKIYKNYRSFLQSL